MQRHVVRLAPVLQYKRRVTNVKENRQVDYAGELYREKRLPQIFVVPSRLRTAKKVNMQRFDVPKPNVLVIDVIFAEVAVVE